MGYYIRVSYFRKPPQHFRGSRPELSDPTTPLLSRCRDRAESAGSPEIQTTYVKLDTPNQTTIVIYLILPRAPVTYIVGYQPYNLKPINPLFR